MLGMGWGCSRCSGSFSNRKRQHGAECRGGCGRRWIMGEACIWEIKERIWGLWGKADSTATKLPQNLGSMLMGRGEVQNILEVVSLVLSWCALEDAFIKVNWSVVILSNLQDSIGSWIQQRKLRKASGYYPGLQEHAHNGCKDLFLVESHSSTGGMPGSPWTGETTFTQLWNWAEYIRSLLHILEVTSLKCSLMK